jgi:hypothetical protein
MSLHSILRRTMVTEIARSGLHLQAGADGDEIQRPEDDHEIR